MRGGAGSGPAGRLTWSRTLVVRAALVLATVFVVAAASRSAAAFQPSIQTEGERVDEYRVKAAILFNLAKFVDWPPDVFADAGAPFVICVLGADPFGPVLDETLRGRTVGQRPAVARRLTEVAPGCQMLFVARSEQNRLTVITERLRGSSVLTVGEDDGFTGLGGMVGLSTDTERVHLDINADAVDRSRLKLSARLLALSARRSAGGAR